MNPFIQSIVHRKPKWNLVNYTFHLSTKQPAIYAYVGVELNVIYQSIQEDGILKITMAGLQCHHPYSKGLNVNHITSFKMVTVTLSKCGGRVFNFLLTELD